MEQKVKRFNIFEDFLKNYAIIRVSSRENSLDSDTQKEGGEKIK